jgi:hypothetical protein
MELYLEVRHVDLLLSCCSSGVKGIMDQMQGLLTSGTLTSGSVVINNASFASWFVCPG